MTDHRSFVEKVRGGSTSHSVAIAWKVGAPARAKYRTLRLLWSDQAYAAYRAIANIAQKNGTAGMRLPIASLRSVLITSLPGALFVVPDVGGIGFQKREEKPGVFAELVLAGQNPVAQAAQAASLWTDNVLSPWAARHGVDPQLVDLLRDLAENGKLVYSTEQSVDLEAAVQTDFRNRRDAIFALLIERVTGKELFAGLGPVKCEIRSLPHTNYLHFLTWPRQFAGEGLWSMTATFSVETVPGHDHPIVRLDVGRRRWCPDVPDAATIYGQRRLAVSLMARSSHFSVQFAVPVSKGEIGDAEDPAFVIKALGAGVDLGVSVSEHIRRGIQNAAFIGLPMRTAFDVKSAVGVGATELDVFDCFDAAAEFLKPDLVSFDVEPQNLDISRTVDTHSHVKPIQFLAWAATSGLGHNELTEESLEEAWRSLLRDEPPDHLCTEDADKALRFFQGAQQANIERIERAFPDRSPAIVAFVRNGHEGSVLDEIIQSLFDGRIRVERRYLPPNVHGPRKDLPSPEKRNLERYEARVEVWRASAQELVRTFEGGCHVIVQAQRFNDDVVNKAAGRIALATIANANVQYLDIRGRNFADYLFRVEAAVLDLLFGHAGLVSDTKTAIHDTFADSPHPPRSIIGVSVVRKNRRRHGTVGSEMLLVTRIDVASGQTTAILGKREDGQAFKSAELPFFEALREAAKWGGASLGKEPETRSATFQRIVDEVIRGNCELGRNPLVLFDATTSRELWPFLRDADIGKPALLNGRPFNPSDDWPGARIVRVRDDAAPCVLTRKATTCTRFDADGNETETFVRQMPTATPGVSRVGLSHVPHFVSMGTNDGKQKLAKGLSVYRSIVCGTRAKKDEIPAPLAGRHLFVETSRLLVEETYRLPGAIDVTILGTIGSDSPAMIAVLVHKLRVGYGHTGMMTTLPAPLFFETKLREYVPSFVLEDDAEEASLPGGDQAAEEQAEEEQGGEKAEAKEPSALDAISFEKLVGLDDRHGAFATAGIEPPPQFQTAAIPTEASTIAFRAVETYSANSREDDTQLPAFIRRLEHDDPELWEIAKAAYVGPAPSFITPEWAAQRITTAGQTIRLIDRKWDRSGELIQPFAEWPMERAPTVEEFCSIVSRLFQTGGGIHYLTQIAREVKPKLRVRGVFRPFVEHSRGLLFSSKSAPTKFATTADFLPRLRELAGAHRDWVRDFVVVEAVHDGTQVDWVAIARSLGDAFSEIVPYLSRLQTFFEQRDTLMDRYRRYLVARKARPEELATLPTATTNTDDPGGMEGSPPPIKVPDFVSNAWLRDKVTLSGHTKTELHQFRSVLRSCAEDPEFWPDTQPDTAGVEGIIVHGFSLPFVHPAICQRFGGGRSKSIFHPFYRKIESILGPLVHRKGEYFDGDSLSSSSDEDILGALVSEGLEEMAKSFAVLRGCEMTTEDALLSTVRGLPNYGDVSDFLLSRKRRIDWAIRHGRVPEGVVAESINVPEESRRDDGAVLPVAGAEPEVVFDQTFEAAPSESLIMEDARPVADARFAQTGQKDVDRAEKTYRAAITSVLSEAQQAAASEPGTDAVSKLRSAVTEVEAAIKDYFDVLERLPKGVSVSALVERLLRLRARIVALAEELEQQIKLATPPDPSARASYESTDQADRLVSEGEAALEAVDADLANVTALRQEMSCAKMGAMARIADEIARASASMQADFDRAAKAYEAGVESLNVGLLAQTPDTPLIPVNASPPSDVAPADGQSISAARADDEPSEAPSRTTGGAESLEQPGTDESSGGEVSKAQANATEARTDRPAEQPEAIETDFSNRGDDLAQADSARVIEPSVESNRPANASNDLPMGDDAERISDEELAELTEMRTTSAQPPTEAVEPESVSAALARTNAALLRLALEGEFALAYHLAVAARMMNPDAILVVDAEEIRFASLSGHMNHTTLQSDPDEVRGWVAKVLTALDSSVREDDIERAIKILLMPSAVEMSLFHPGSGAVEVLRRFGGVDKRLDEVANELTLTVQKISHSTGVTLTQPILASVENEMDFGSVSAGIRKEIRDDISHFGLMKFDFQLGTKVRNSLVSPDHDLGKLRASLDQDDDRALDAARAFVHEAANRSMILAMLERAEDRIEGLRSKGIDGAARNKIVAEIIRIHDQAARYIAARSEMHDARGRDHSKVRDWVTELRRRLTTYIEAVEGATGSSYLAQACAVTLPRLRALDSLLAGKARSVSSVEHLLALHGPLALIPNLHFGRSWFPTPYNAAVLIATIEMEIVPLLPADQTEREQMYATVMRRRLNDRSFVAARLLLAMASEFGINEKIVAQQANAVDQAVGNAKGALRDRIEAVTSRIDKVLRFGAVSNQTMDKAEELLSQVRQVECTDVFAEISNEERVEQIVAERLTDARLAFDFLDEIDESAGGLLNQPREEMVARIENLVGRLPEQDITALRGLVADDDLHTAEEWVETAEATGLLPTPSSRRNRVKRFVDDVLPKAATAQSGGSGNPAEFIEQQKDYCGIKFSELTALRAAESAAIFRLWKDINNRLPNMKEHNFTAQFMTLLEKIGLTGGITPVEANPALRIYIAEYKRTFVNDRDGLLLPDFGSRAEGQRIVLMANMPAEGTMARICADAGSYYVILFVTDVVNPVRRAQFLEHNVRGQHKVILIDSASLLFALGEQETRPLTLLELGQPYSFVAPYKDWEREAVPPEMFVGREDDINQIFAADGSCVVYGGRRMGKTALLRHIKATRDAPDRGVQVGYIDLQPIMDSLNTPRRIWSVIAENLPAVFPQNTAQGVDQTKVIEGIRKWLNDDQRRRILLCIDECDRFVVSDAAQDYPVFLALQQLMTETRRRFKFVLSGLADVTRLAQTGNPPLKQISANPRRIGPLMGRELKDAEDLVIRPFAALGIEFEKRQDVWKILSHSNYYPVLIQTYSQRLLTRVMDKIREDGRPVRSLSPQLVSSVLDDALIRSNIKEIFMMTLRIDRRYQVIAYAIAYGILNAEAEGKLQEGMSVREIRETALYWWPKGFAEKNRLSLFEDLLDEMEGLGVLRKLDSDRWSLRSSAVLRLLGSRGDIDNGLQDFIGLEPPREFDPKSLRRYLERNDRRASPLTFSQEREVLRDATPVHLVLGAEIADIALVASALRSAPESFSDADAFQVDVQKYASQGELLERIRRHRTSSTKLTVVVPQESAWTLDWIHEAIRQNAVRERRAKIVFVGNSEHVERLVTDQRFRHIVSSVRITTLEPWSEPFIDRVMKRCDLNWGDVRSEANAQIGGWNSLMNKVADKAYQLRPNERTPSALARIIKEAALPIDVGVRQVARGSLAAVLASIAKWYPDAPFRAEDVDACLKLDNADGAGIHAAEAIALGMTLGLLAPVPSSTSGDEQRTQYLLSEFASRLFSSRPALAAE